MQNKIEQIIARVYKTWRQKFPRAGESCPDEETLASFFEGRLAQEESQRLKNHIIGCDRCSELIVFLSQEVKEIPVPEELINRAKNMILNQEKAKTTFLEIILGFKEKVIDLIKTSGDILFGQEFASLPVLRSRNIKDFGQEVIIVKDLGNIKTEIEIENKTNYHAKITVKLSDINTGKPTEGLRITLIRAKQEIESYITESGKTVFDNVPADKYSVEISSPELIIGKILLEIKKINEATT